MFSTVYRLIQIYELVYEPFIRGAIPKNIGLEGAKVEKVWETLAYNIDNFSLGRENDPFGLGYYETLLLSEKFNIGTYLYHWNYVLPVSIVPI